MILHVATQILPVVALAPAPKDAARCAAAASCGAAPAGPASAALPRRRVFRRLSRSETAGLVGFGSARTAAQSGLPAGPAGRTSSSADAESKTEAETQSAAETKSDSDGTDGTDGTDDAMACGYDDIDEAGEAWEQRLGSAKSRSEQMWHKGLKGRRDNKYVHAASQARRARQGWAVLAQALAHQARFHQTPGLVLRGLPYVPPAAPREWVGTGGGAARAYAPAGTAGRTAAEAAFERELQLAVEQSLAALRTQQESQSQSQSQQQQQGSAAGGAGRAVNPLDVVLPCGLTQRQVQELQQRDLSSTDYELLLVLDAQVAPRTLAANRIAEFPVATVAASEVGQVCPICVEPFGSASLKRTLPCGHIFCPGCIETWLQKSSTRCPLDGLSLGD
eukprot:TRINITY_DN1900_c0_g1_i5.p1 TRINITY_DN1900_c0_g1~~TRINITY_DN1900_c0_g1_i5.p1  ORF type:complete len:407 (+),score=81.65 TRINITY_DN1900_c0_g1_i5:46-1221(+)